MSIVSESELDRRDMKERMTFEQRQTLEEKKQSRSKFEQTLHTVFLIAVAIFLLALYFCSMKLTTLLSKQISTFEIMYHRSLWGLILLTVYQVFIRKGVDPIKTSFFDGVSRWQFPFVMIRVVGTTTAHLIIFMALRLTSTSKVILIFENPFLTSILAYFIIGETITIHEVIVFALSTIGIILLSRSNQKGEESKEFSGELIGILLCLLAAFLANLSTLALR